ncbi:hypothetical protein E2C01_032448 [Portunus trituberculatus]|uniref:Uncharacterized protein n=1 Tax=Portunus trituberculatus TaxID=210409 RepID=A0A5B7EVA6_PORTR|nr:hypothetical protein [Portunus trituberculatus]
MKSLPRGPLADEKGGHCGSDSTVSVTCGDEGGAEGRPSRCSGHEPPAARPSPHSCGGGDTGSAVA